MVCDKDIPPPARASLGEYHRVARAGPARGMQYVSPIRDPLGDHTRFGRSGPARGAAGTHHQLTANLLTLRPRKSSMYWP